MTLQEQTIMRAANPVNPHPDAAVVDRAKLPGQIRSVEK
jgi:hypothetical protein